MSSLNSLLNNYRNSSMSEREKGSYFEELIIQYFKHEASYQDLYSTIWSYADWAHIQGLPKNDAGIDLVAQTQGTNEYHAIQCKFYSEDYRVQKADIDSFFTASGKKTFSHRIIVSTTNNWSTNAEDALQNQHPPVSKIDLNDLENSKIDWSKFQPNTEPVLKDKKQLREHQQTALNAVTEGFATAKRGKLIMACGTGKTFTSLKIAEAHAGKGKRVLFLVPSLSLLSQTLTEWTQESTTPLHSFAVCSDSDVGKKRNKDEESVQTFMHELRYPATTEPSRLAVEMTKRHDAQHMSVVFSTYHSIDVISKAQKQFALADFDLIVCDEAHRTTGATFDDEDESTFVKVHDADYIKAHRRLYMTATPRIYGEIAKASADKDAVTLCSMDDEALFGKELYVITFSEAVKRDLLVDYKVLVLAVDEAHVSRNLQKLFADDDNQLKVDDAAKIIGCWKALSKQDMQEDNVDDQDPMRRAVAFCQVIEPSVKATSHKVSSKNIASMFAKVVEAYQEQEKDFDDNDKPMSIKLRCEAEHIDGGMNASQKESKLNWLKADAPDNTCRILSNVRCLSEGVDVPALDAVLFLTPRNSQVDVVQSVGRVMRKSEGKKRGYVVLPVVIPAGMEAHEALNDNKSFRVVWQVLQALRSHDDRFDAMTNKIDINGYADISKMEIIAITDKVNRKTPKDYDKTKNEDAGKNSFSIGTKFQKPSKDNQSELQFNIGEIERAIYAKVVQKCGNRSHWEDWANDIAKIAKTHITRITTILETPSNTEEIKAFNAFAEELKDDLNNSITNAEIIEMLAQHLITKPVFDALFEGYSFASKNPMSLAMQDVLDALHAHNIEKEAVTLQRFYDSVKLRAQGIDNASGKQKIVVELYDKFFQNAFPKLRDKLGIVYTPVEAVDFIIHSVNEILQTEFNQNLGSDNVHIIDPFTGTGTFITRLLQTGVIPLEKLTYKYKNEIHANEIILLAYYISAINVESVFHDIVGGDYEPFNGICLTDTFQLHEKGDLVSELLVDNSARRNKQKALDIRVIIGNPPYSVGQDNANANNQNVAYPQLDEKIRNTYAKYSNATLKNSLYDSYIRAIRWASDRIKNAGVIGFITNAGFIEANTGDGLRKCLAEEFSSIYIFHLRGNARLSGEQRRKEKDNVFGQGTRTPIAISILVKNPHAKEHGKIYFHDIGDYLTRDQKLQKISELVSIKGITENESWTIVTPDKHNDWLNQRDDSFSEHISLGEKKDKTSISLFENYSRGVATSRDAWCYNFSKNKLENNILKSIGFYNSEVERYIQSGGNVEASEFVKFDSTLFSWDRANKWDLEKRKKYTFERDALYVALYRPFSKSNLYFSRQMNNMVYQMHKIFPSANTKNLVICLAITSSKDFSVLISDSLPDLHLIGDAQCFPLYLYEATRTDVKNDLFSNSFQDIGLTKQDAISLQGLAHFQNAYSSQNLTKEDIFYYVYGLLHSEDYKTRYKDNLSKELPRIPCLKKTEDFWTFSKAGRALAKLHINYETVAPYPVEYEEGKLGIQKLIDEDYRVNAMKFAKGKNGEKYDKTKVIYNSKITMTGIPLEAYEYSVNGKSALEWVMERQAVTTHKDSGIVNDANDWAIQTMGNARYPLELFQRVITVSLETMKIVNGLPDLDIQ